MTPSEAELLETLAWMCAQYLGDDESLDHQCMSAGEGAIALLVRHGLVEPAPGGGAWTAAGRDLLAGRR